jgi:hypothetical protein
MTSTIRRERAKTMLLSPSLAAVRAMRVVCERAEARMPRSGIDHRRIPEQEMTLALGCAGFRDRRDRIAAKPLGQLGRVGDGRRGEDEGRLHAIEPTDPTQPPKDIGDMRAEHAAIGMQLIHHDVGESLEKLRPLGVMRQDRLMQHVRIAEHDVAARAHRLAGIAGRVAIEGECLHGRSAGSLDRPAQIHQLGCLVLGKRLGRKKIERLAALRQDGIEHRQVVAERLARGGRCGDHQVSPCPRQIPCLALVTVESRPAARRQRPSQG